MFVPWLTGTARKYEIPSEYLNALSVHCACPSPEPNDRSPKANHYRDRRLQAEFIGRISKYGGAELLRRRKN